MQNKIRICTSTNMDNSELHIHVQKNCEILSIQPESKKGQYSVTAKFTNETNECVTSCPLHIKGTPENIGRILKFLGEKYAAHEVEEDELDNPLLDRVVFEIKGENVIAMNQDTGNLILSGKAPAIDAGKVIEISSRVLRPGKQAPAALTADYISKIKKLWAETNSNRKLRTDDRIKQKISDLHAFVRELAAHKKIPQERIDEAVEELEHRASLNEVLNVYRMKYFPELEAELKELQDCEECIRHFSIES